MKKNIKWSIAIQEILQTKNHGLTQGEIIEALKKQQTRVDRVTIYRNLKKLLASGAIHQVTDNRYLSCQHHCSQHAHIIIFCQNCQRSSEISKHPQIEAIFNSLESTQFFSKYSPLTIKGHCQSCQ